MTFINSYLYKEKVLGIETSAKNKMILVPFIRLLYSPGVITSIMRLDSFLNLFLMYSKRNKFTEFI